MIFNTGIKFTLLGCTLLLTGCVTGTRGIDLPVPQYENEATSKGAVYIGSVSDNRQFEQKPASPSTPSVDGDLASTPEEDLATLIGRQRNGYGMALGDVALLDGATVQDKTRALLEEALTSRGYSISESSDVAIKLNIDIEKFWAWFSPGLFTVSFEAQIETGLDFDSAGKAQTLSVTGYGLNKGQIASDANWALAYERAFTDFLEKLDLALDAAGL